MKAYVKPELFYERFELSKHIADCALEFVNSTTVDKCYAKADPKFFLGFEETDRLFISNACTLPTEHYCYTDGSDGFNLFVS
ncbi:MAG: hypothetical protein ACI4PO_04160 [Faecousia sp.]